MKKTIIISAELSNLSRKENLIRTNTLRIILKEFGKPKDAIGSYNGTMEQSFVIRADIADIARLAKSMGQESVLVVDHNAKAVLHFMDGGTEAIGTLKVVDKHVALEHDAWTLVDGKYLVAA